MLKNISLARISCAIALMFSVGVATAAPVLGGGWAGDEIGDPFTDSGGSPYSFSGPVIFRITDQFIAGDTYFVSDFGTLILTTVFDGAHSSISPIGDPAGDLGWTDASYSHGEIDLSAGAHLLTVQGDGVGGIPAGFYARIDTTAAIPEPETYAMLLAGLGLMGFVARHRKQQIKQQIAAA